MTAKVLSAHTGPRVRINVTQEIIDAGIRRSSSHCMIAEAIEELIPEARHIAVDLQTIRWSDPEKGVRYTYLTPRAAQVHLVNYDQGEEVEPISFSLSRPMITQAGTREKAKAAKATLKNSPSDKEIGMVPQRVGGKTPPSGALSNRVGKRREYGLRSVSR